MFSKDIAEYLESHNFGKLSENIFLLDLPEKLGRADNAISVVDRPSFGYNRELNSANFRCQILVRNNSLEEGGKIADEIYKLIFNKDKFIIVPSGKRYLVRTLDPPVLFDVDSASRYMYLLNISCISGI